MCLFTIFLLNINTIAYSQMALAMWGSYSSKGRIAAGVGASFHMYFHCFASVAGYRLTHRCFSHHFLGIPGKVSHFFSPFSHGLWPSFSGMARFLKDMERLESTFGVKVLCPVQRASLLEKIQ